MDALSSSAASFRDMNTLKEFETGRLLGKGNFGQVWLCRHIESGFVMAMKVLYKSYVESRDVVQQLEREVSIQYHLRHENILRLFSYFHDSDRFYILLEYCDGESLMQKMEKQNKFTEPQAAFYIDQLASALIHCHKRNVIHRGVKLENILIAANGVLKLADFGWSVKMTETGNSRRTTFCGTLDYLTPEVLSDCPHDCYVDNWSVGILLYEFLHGVGGPFAVADEHQTADRIRDVVYEVPANFPEGPKDIVSKLLVREPHARMELHDLKKHWWTVEEGKKYEDNKH